MKKMGAVLLFLLTLTLLFPVTASADMGPKPSVVIHFNGFEGKTYYVTLLSSSKSTGPYSALDDNNRAYSHYQAGDKDYDIFLKFAEYQDTDGFYFLQFFKDCSQTQQFKWTYYPPQRFKILLYFPETDRFIVSDQSYERYAFDSYFTAKAYSADSLNPKSADSLSIAKSYNYAKELPSLAVRIILTIIIELVIAILFGYRAKNQLLFFALVNAITQIALNIALNIIYYYSGPLAFVFFYVLLEMVVFAVEAVLYTGYLKKHSEKKIPHWKPGVYAFVANAASFIVGLGLAHWLSDIF